MKVAKNDYILKIIGQTNILPVTSACTTGCVFCSHKNNPEGIEAYALPRLSFEDIKMFSEYLDGHKKIVIGESASRIIEGEPFLREDMVDILAYLRGKYPDALLEITTGGAYLTRDNIIKLKELEPIEINISLNSATPKGRELLHKCAPKEALEAVKYMDESGLTFNGSIVAMPHIVGYEDIEETIGFLARNGARSIRVFVPGFSYFAGVDIDFFSIRKKLHDIGDSMYDEYNVPVLVEPPEIDNLKPVACGIMKGSSAYSSGILKGDTIIKVDGRSPLTRVDAYNMLYKAENPTLEILRRGKTVKLSLKKERDTSSGAVFYYDIHPDTIYSIENMIRRGRGKNPLIVTSELAYPVIKMALEKFGKEKAAILPVKNHWFGGTIMCAGLLTVQDIIRSIEEKKLQKNHGLILLPSAPFDINGRDLSGRYYYEVEEKLGLPVMV